MRISRNQSGAGHIVLILGVVVIAAISVVGYKVYQNNQDTASTTSEVKTAAEPAQIKSKADVEAASQSIDSTSLDTVDPAQLDSDLNSVL